MNLKVKIKINFTSPAIRTYVSSNYNRFLSTRCIIKETQPLDSYFGIFLYPGITVLDINFSKKTTRSWGINYGPLLFEVLIKTKRLTGCCVWCK